MKSRLQLVPALSHDTDVAPRVSIQLTDDLGSPVAIVHPGMISIESLQTFVIAFMIYDAPSD